MVEFIKLPIIIVDMQKAQLMGMDKAPEQSAYSYFRIDKIEYIRQGHDDTISEELNTEGTVIGIQNGESFMIPLPIDEVMELINYDGMSEIINK